MNKLPHDKVLELRRAIIAANLAESRAALLAGLPADVAAALPVARSPGEQVLCDIVSLNEATDIHGNVSWLRHWLSNAAELASTRPEAILFKAAILETSPPSQEDRPGAPLMFSVVRLDSTERNWIERPLPDAPEWDNHPRHWHCGSVFEQQYAQFYCLKGLVYDADITFDVTLRSTLQEPLILSQVGVHIFAVAHFFRLAGVPTAAPVVQSRSYELTIPNIFSELLERPEQLDIPPTILKRDVLLQLPDPVYFEPSAPFRFSLRLKNYQGHVPRHSIAALVARSDRGAAQSHFMRLQA